MPITLDDLQTAIWVYNIKHYCIIWENQADLINEIENWVLNRAMNDLLMFKQIISQHITLSIKVVTKPRVQFAAGCSRGISMAKHTP
jgi:hypothetical protein